MKFYDKENKRLLLFEEKATASFWDKHWDKSDMSKQIQSGGSRVVKKFTKIFLQKGSKILEGGCGIGQNVYGLKMLGYDCYGVDFASKTIGKIKQYFSELKVDAQDLKNLNFPDCFFDGYWCLGVIEHNFEGYQDILNEALRVIKPGGFLFLTFPFMSPLRKIKARLGMYPLFAKKDKTDNFYEFILDKNEVKKNAIHCGFTFISCYSLDAVKGMKDEISFLRSFLKRVYQSRNILIRAMRYLISIVIASFCGHLKLMVFQKV